MFLPTPASILNGPVREMLNKRVELFGAVERIERMEGGGLAFTVLLLGEKEPVVVRLRSAEIATDNSTVTPRGLSSDKPWLNNLLRDFVEGRTIPLPAGSSLALSLAKPILPLIFA